MFQQVNAVQLQQGKTRFWQRGEWPEEAVAVLEALGLDPGPRTGGSEVVHDDA